MAEKENREDAANRGEKPECQLGIPQPVHDGSLDDQKEPGSNLTVIERPEEIDVIPIPEAACKKCLVVPDGVIHQIANQPDHDAQDDEEPDRCPEMTLPAGFPIKAEEEPSATDLRGPRSGLASMPQSPCWNVKRRRHHDCTDRGAHADDDSPCRPDGPGLYHLGFEKRHFLPPAPIIVSLRPPAPARKRRC